MGSYSGYSSSWEIDISDNHLIITDAQSIGFPFFSMTFNGWILSVVSGPSILSASVDGASSFSPFAIHDDELTPIVLENESVVGWGWAFLERNVERYEIRIRHR